MLHLTRFVQKTKAGQVRQGVKEHYLRDDIESGSPLDPQCSAENVRLAEDAKFYVIVDAATLLRHADLIEHASVTNVIVPGLVFHAVRSGNTSVFLRLKEMLRSSTKHFYFFSNEHCKETYAVQQQGETLKARDERALRMAAAWYKQRVLTVPTLLLLSDAGSVAKAREEGLSAVSPEAFIKEHLKDESLLDLIPWDEDEEADSAAKQRKKRGKVFEEHLSFSAVSNGVKAGRLFQSSLRVNRFNPYEGWVTHSALQKNVLIKDKLSINRAFDGDSVVVELLPEAQWSAPSTRLPGKDKEHAEEADTDAHIVAEVEAPPEPSGRVPTGKVVYIAKRNWRSRGYAGSLKPSENITPGRTASVLFAPVERKFPYIRVRTHQAEALMSKRIVVAVDEWPADSQYPLGHYTGIIGTIGEAATEGEVLLLEYDVNTSPFSPAVHACVPPLPWSVGAEDYAAPYRRDLRDVVVCSVDPPGCKDIDDALHARELPNGNLEIGVHIADVTHFVHAGSAMDEEASRRSTTVYLVDKRVDMLPKPLTEDICSLRANVERLAFSAVWEVTPDIEEVSVTFHKSIIKSRAALTYEAAQNMIDDRSQTDEVATSLRLLMRASKVLRKRRYDAGALNLASPEVKITRGADADDNSALDVKMYELRETNAMVEEMMLMANISVATHIHRAFPACAILRRHEPPTPAMFEPLLQIAKARGITMEFETSKQLAESLNRARSEKDPYFNRLLRIMATRCMTQAKYMASGDCAVSEFLHYGLAAPIYTHFTSPIRRYADVLVHRCLAASLHLIPLPESLKDRDLMAEVVDNMNVRHTNAQLAGRSSVELHTRIFFRGKTTLADARVVKLQANGMIVMVPKFGIEGPVYFGEKGDQDMIGTLNEARQEVTLANGTRYKIFDMCAVKIYVQQHANHRESLRMELIERSQLPKADMVLG